MDKWTADKLESQRVLLKRRDPAYPNAPHEIEVIDTDHTVSWEVYGKGVASVRVTASLGPKDGAPWIAVNISETKLASKNYNQKRDVTKETFFTVNGPAAFELFEMLREVFEPVVKPGETA